MNEPNEGAGAEEEVKGLEADEEAEKDGDAAAVTAVVTGGKLNDAAVNGFPDVVDVAIGAAENNAAATDAAVGSNDAVAVNMGVAAAVKG